MIYLNAFIFCGLVCALGELILSYSKFTPGHLNTLLVIIGAFLSSTGIYEKIVLWAGAGATVPITNFGHLLVLGAIKGYEKAGILGFLKEFFSGCSGGLTITIISAFFVSLIFKPKH